MMGRTLAAVSSTTRAISSLAQSSRQNADQYCQTGSNCFSNNAPASRNLQVITGRAAIEGARERVCFAQEPIVASRPSARERVCFAQKPIAATKRWPCEQPNNHSAAALHLVPRGRPQASIVLSA